MEATFCKGVVDHVIQQAPEMDEESNGRGGEVAPKKKLGVTPKEMRVASRRVDHTYRDYSEYPPSAVVDGKLAKATANFPARLHQILSTPEFECVSR